MPANKMEQGEAFRHGDLPHIIVRALCDAPMQPHHDGPALGAIVLCGPIDYLRFKFVNRNLST
ncbi:hypothetical protein AA309_07085 [Microvirga vignae]|uniref:Uncharacterized protein n=1 Tax=Microvirga vignae TaxID=1225564 RepID=A0A0H1RF11_9HYPH|nr:hypothetical protein AA309_07085 [Microvirga vignae]